MKHFKLCRICTKVIKKDDELIKLFEKTENWITKIEEITGVLLKNSKPLPQYICKLCHGDLESAYDFRERCINAQEYFNSVDFVGYKTLTSDLEIKDEVPQSIEEFSNAEGFCRTELQIKDELPIEEHNIAEFCFVKSETLDVLQEEEECHDIDGSSSCSGSGDTAEINAEISSLNNTTKNQETAPKVKRQYRKRIRRPSEERKKREEKLKKALRRKLKTEDDSKTFICDQCGIYFDCKSKFLLHQRRHTGDKEYHCEICPEQFFLHSELKRHVRKHTGERPYPCRYCERRFMDCSTRFRHESSFLQCSHVKLQQKEKKIIFFPCNLCGKWKVRNRHL